MTSSPFSFSLDRRHFLAGAASLAALSRRFHHECQCAKHGHAQERWSAEKLGIGGGSTTDNLDPRILKDWVPVKSGLHDHEWPRGDRRQQSRRARNFRELESQPGAVEWSSSCARASRSITQEFDGRNVIYSINLHRGETTSAARSCLRLKSVDKLSDTEVKIVLESGNADLPYILF